MSFTFKPLSVEVSAHRTSDDMQHTLFVILVKWANDKFWTIERRFSEFDTLRNELAEAIPTVPELPSKTFLRTFDNDFIVERRTGLDQFLKQCIQIEFIMRSRSFCNFLQVHTNIPSIVDVRPRRIKAFQDSRFGVNDFIYLEDKRIVITVCEDYTIFVGITETIGGLWGKLTGAPEEEETKSNVIMGSINVWRIKDDGNFTLQFRTDHRNPITSIVYDDIRGQVMVSLSDGTIECYLVEEGSSPPLLLSHTYSKVHDGRITSMYYDNKKDLLYSVGQDKQLIVHNMMNQSIVCSGIICTSWLSTISIKSDSARAFVGTYGGEILVVDVSQEEPKVVHTLLGHKGSVRSIHYESTFPYLYSSGFDFNIGLWTLENGPDRIRLAGFFENGPQYKVKSLVYCPSTQQIVSGHDYGFICVWNALSGDIYYVDKAHSDSVVKLQWMNEPAILVTGSLDHKVKFYKFFNIKKKIDLSKVQVREVKSSPAELAMKREAERRLSQIASTSNKKEEGKEILTTTTVSDIIQENNNDDNIIVGNDEEDDEDDEDDVAIEIA